MDASRNPVDVGIDMEMEMMMSGCDICSQPATDPVGTICGHIFCWSCVNEAFHQGEVQGTRPCPVCGADLLQEIVHYVPIRGHHTGSVSSATTTTSTAAGPISSGNSTVEAAANSDMIAPHDPIPSANVGIAMRLNRPLNARMDALQNLLDATIDRTHAQQLDLSRQTSERRGARIRQLEQNVDNLVDMNSALLRQMEARDGEITRLTRLIDEFYEQWINVWGTGWGNDTQEGN